MSLCFALWPALFWDTGFSKIGNAPNDPRMTFITEVSKIPCVICQPLFSPPYRIVLLTSSRLPADGASKPISRTAQRSLQLVNPSIGSEVMSVFTYFKSVGFTAQIQQLRTWDLWNHPPVFINNGLLSNEPVLASVKDKTPSGLFFRRFSPGKTCISLEEPFSG